MNNNPNKWALNTFKIKQPILIGIVLLLSISLFLGVKSLSKCLIETKNKQVVAVDAVQDKNSYGEPVEPVEKRDLSYVGSKVTYHAELKRFSTSGDMRFYWYDLRKNQRVNPDDEYSWFFALPPDVPYSDKATDKWVKFIEANKTSIFKIIGRREPDDCGYYGADHCIQSINIEDIEIPTN